MTIPEKHQLRIAKRVICESEAMTLIMGGMTKDEARAILNRHGVPHVQAPDRQDITKAVGYSYPSSPNAEQFGFYKTGCYTVDHVICKNRQFYAKKAIAAFATENEAVAYARSLPNDWCPLCLAYHPEYADGSTNRNVPPTTHHGNVSDTEPHTGNKTSPPSKLTVKVNVNVNGVTGTSHPNFASVEKGVGI